MAGSLRPPLINHLTKLLIGRGFKRRPSTPSELRDFCCQLLAWDERRDVILSADDGIVVSDGREWRVLGPNFGRALQDGGIRTQDAEAVWSLLGAVAGSEPYPALELGPYTSDRFREAITRVMAWCDARTQRAATVSSSPAQTPPPEEKAKPLPEEKPKWDTTTRTLTFDGRELKRYKRHPADNQTRVLSEFESAGWPRSIPLPVRVDQVRDTVRGLNKAVGEGSPISFSSDGTGKSIRWDIVPE
jgi:hypothetical protein